MTQLRRDPRSGGWKARKAIPETISAEYARLYGPKVEAKFSLPHTINERDARSQFAEWQAEIETRFQRLPATSLWKGRIDRRHVCGGAAKNAAAALGSSADILCFFPG